MNRASVARVLAGRPKIIELSSGAYKEIWEQLALAGYDWLIFPDFGQIAMDGFVVRNGERGRPS